jgi:hypothetical protein
MSKCILWKKAISSNGYGASFYKGKYISSHRLAWIKANGAIPKGLLVLHKCDIRHCINPKHLWLGTQYENIHDMIKKGRCNPFNPTKVKNGKKPCNKCMKIKPLSEFHKTGTSRYTGITIYRPACKICR